MSAKRRNRKRKPARRKEPIDPKPLILIVCEGEVTEPEYLLQFTNYWENPRVEIEIADDHGTPKKLVEIAKKLKKQAEKNAKREKDDFLAYDAVWCVFDIDEHPFVADAVQMAEGNDIRLAISNPSFELWLLLHFQDSPGMQSRETIRQMLKKHLPEYDKHIDFATWFAEGYSEAVLRADKLNDQMQYTEPWYEHNPATGVYRLTELIRE